MAEAPLILLSNPALVPLRAAVEAKGWRWVAPDAMTDAERGQVRAILHAGRSALTPDVMLSLPRPGLLACVAAGYDDVDVAWCRANGFEVTHAQGDNAEEVADLAVGLLLAAWRDIPAGDRQVRESRWGKLELGAELPRGMSGRDVGIVGLGHIGRAIARRVEAFGARIAWWGPNPRAAPWPRAASLLDLAAASDILVVAARAEPGNRGLISAEVIEAVGPAGMVVNIGRGSLVDEAALIAALKARRLGRAALDVFEVEPTPADRWADVPGVVLSPHVGGATRDGIDKLMAQALENIRRHLAGEPLASPVAR